jgi:hypothetical protein
MTEPCKQCGVEGCTGRGPGGRVLPGHTSNPGGRVPTWLKEVRAELRGGSTEASQLLRRVIGDAAERTQDRIAAAKTVLEFTVTKPKHTVKVEGNTDNPLKGISAELLAKWAAEDPSGSSNSGSA